jgi:hypothetical protein
MEQVENQDDHPPLLKIRAKTLNIIDKLFLIGATLMLINAIGAIFTLANTLGSGLAITKVFTSYPGIWIEMKLIIIPCTCLIGPRCIAAAIYYKLRLPYEYIFSVLLSSVAVVAVQDPHEIVSACSFLSLLMAYLVLLLLEGPTSESSKYLHARFLFYYNKMRSYQHQNTGTHLQQNTAQNSEQTVTTVSTSPQQKVIIWRGSNRESQRWERRMYEQLGVFEQQGTVELWNESKIPPGAQRAKVIEQAITSASVVILLVNADLLRSSFMAPRTVLWRAAHQHHIWICPLIVSSCLYEESVLSEFQPYYSEDVNPLHKPLADLPCSKQTETLCELARAIGKKLALSKTN